MKHSDFKCEKCDKGWVYTGDGCHDTCPCDKRSAVEITPLKVPEWYEFLRIYDRTALFVNKDAVTKFYEYPIKLPHKLHQKQKFVCEVCGGSGVWKVKLKKIEEGFYETVPEPCDVCKGKQIHATLVSIEVKDNKLIERWEE